MSVAEPTLQYSTTLGSGAFQIDRFRNRQLDNEIDEILISEYK